MKKIFSLMLCILLITLTFFGCSGKSKNANASSDNDNKLSIVTTIFPQYDFLRVITDSVDVDLKMLISPGTEVHGFEASLSDISSIYSSDMFVYVGGEGDEWVDKVKENADEKKTEFISLCDIVETVEEETVSGMENEEEKSESGEVEMDEHVWTSPKNAILIVQQLTDKLCKIDNKNSEIYKNNSNEYISKLKKLDEGFTEAVNNGKRKTVVFAERFPFRYLAKDYGLTYFAAFKGCSSSTEPSLSTINFLINQIKDNNIPVVFYIEFSTEEVANKIVSATGVKKLRMHSCHNVSQEDFDNGESYLSLMQDNLNNLKTALS